MALQLSALCISLNQTCRFLWQTGAASGPAQLQPCVSWTHNYTHTLTTSTDIKTQTRVLRIKVDTQFQMHFSYTTSLVGFLLFLCFYMGLCLDIALRPYNSKPNKRLTVQNLSPSLNLSSCFPSSLHSLAVVPLLIFLHGINLLPEIELTRF